MKDNKNIYKLINETNHLNNILDEIESYNKTRKDSDSKNFLENDDSKFALTAEQRNRILQDFKSKNKYFQNRNENKTTKKNIAIIGTLVASLIVAFYIHGNNSVYAFIQNTIDNIQLSLSQVFQTSSFSDEYSIKYMGNSEKIEKYRIKVDKIWVDSHKVYVNTLIAIPYDKNTVIHYVSLNGIDFLINGKHLANDSGMSENNKFICNTDDGYQIFSHNIIIDLSERYNEKIDNITFNTNGIHVESYSKNVLTNAMKKYIENNNIKALNKTIDSDKIIIKKDKFISFKIENKNIELSTDTKEIRKGIVFTSSDNKFIFKNISYNKLGAQAVLYQYSNNKKSSSHPFVIASDDKGNKIELKYYVGNGTDNNAIKYVMSADNNNSDVMLSTFMMSEKITFHLFEEKESREFEDYDSIDSKEFYKKTLKTIIDENIFVDSLGPEIYKTSNTKLDKRARNSRKIGEIIIDTSTGDYKIKYF